MTSAVNSKIDSPIAHLMKGDPDLMPFLKEGDILEVKFIAKQKGAAYFDLGRFGTGIIYGAELSNAKNILKELKPNDTVSAKVINTENEEGYVEISLAGAYQQKQWQQIKALKESGEAFNVKIIGANSGGLITEVNEVKAFLPVSQLTPEHYPRIENGDKSQILTELRKMVGQELSVKIIDFKPAANKLIISEREAVSRNVAELISQYKVGDVIKGLVTGLADFGVFIQFVGNPSIEGFVHISELDHRLIEHPKEMLKMNEQVQAKIIEIKDNKISLSLKALKPDPWETINEKYKEEQEVSGVVYKLNNFGALVNIGADVQGLVRISEFGGVEEMKTQLTTGKTYQFIIQSIKPQEKRIVLKLKK